MSVFISLLVTALVLQAGNVFSLKEGDCEVCVGLLNKVYAKMTDSGDGDSAESARKHLLDVCKSSKTKEERFCYAIGGKEESATSILKTVTDPMGYRLPALKLCEKLNRQDPQICELKYDKMIDLRKVDLKKLKVRDLKKVLNDWDEVCDGCLEKSEFIKRIEELKPIHMREEL